MAKILRYFFFIAFVFYSGLSHAQISEEARDAIEKYIENRETNADFSQVLEDLTAYLDKPLNLNSSTLEELMNFPLFSPMQAIAIVQHRNQFGNFLHVHELQVLGFKPEELHAILPFVTVEKSTKDQFKDLLVSLDQGELLAMSTWKRKYPIVPAQSQQCVFCPFESVAVLQQTDCLI